MEDPSHFSVGQTAQSLTCSIMEKPHTGLDDCLYILLTCFRLWLSVPERLFLIHVRYPPHKFRQFLLDFRGFMHFGAGLSVGLSGLAAGYAIGIVGDAGVRGTAQQPRLFVGMILILIFAEVLGLYGLIVAIYLFSQA